MRFVYRIILLLSLLVLVSCSAPGNTKVDQRKHIDTMTRDVLSELYKLKPDSRDEIRSASGYAVFSNVNLHLFFLGAGNGFGVVVDNSSAKKTYMKMGEASLGFGVGIKDLRMVFVFQSRDVMNNFVETGWAVGGQADAAAKAEEKGAAVGGEVTLDGVKIYQLTETGLALQVTVKGTKYWKYDELNN